MMRRRQCAGVLVAVITAAGLILGTTSTAGALSSATAPARGGAAPAGTGSGSTAAEAARAATNAGNSAQCVFNPVTTCGSTDLDVAIDWWSSDQAIQNGCVWDATVDWGDGTPVQTVPITSATTYAFLASHNYAKPGPETITLGGSSQTAGCTVIPGTYYFDPSDHYVVTTEAWIPFAAVVDPEIPVTELYPALTDVQNILDPNCYNPPFFTAFITTVGSTYRGDGHAGFGGSYRVATEVSFDFDSYSDEITNFSADPIAPAGASYRDKVYTARGKVIGRCSATETATNQQTAELDGDTSFTVGYEGKNPLVRPAFLVPPIVGTINGSVAADGSLTLSYDTTQFPSHGIQVSINGQTVLTTIENDASCLPSGDVLGLAGATTLLRGLTSHESGSVTASPGGSNSTSKPSPLC